LTQALSLKYRFRKGSASASKKMHHNDDDDYSNVHVAYSSNIYKQRNASIYQTDSGFFMYIKSGLAFWFFLFTVIYFIVIVPWCIVAALGLLDGAEAYVHVLDDIVFILGFVFYIWLSDSLHGYTNSPEQLRRLLRKISSLSASIQCYITVSIEDIQSGLIDTPDDGSAENRSIKMDRIQRLQIARRNLQNTFVKLAKYSINLFTQDAIPVKDLFKVTQRQHSKTIPAQKGVDILLTSTLLDMKRLIDRKCIKTADVNMINSDIGFIRKVIEDVDVANTVCNPPILKNHIRFILAAYFLVWMPFRMAFTSGWVALVVYPILMDIMTGIVIIRYWLKNPFDKSRPISYMDYDKWIRDCIEDIRNPICLTINRMTGDTEVNYIESSADT
jgi:hypothetical protein